MITDQELKDEIETVTEQMRQLVDSVADLNQDQVQTLNGRITQCITLVNRRLKACDALLRKGLRSEALQECRKSPDLLELISELDVPELDVWNELLGMFLLPPPPSLNRDLAALLNEAFAREQSLDQLLRLHRLHALARSDLKSRINVLRSLAAKDADNWIWREDLVTYETRRLQQLERAFLNLKNPDLASLNAIYEELNSGQWTIECKPAFRNDLERRIEILNAEYARAQLTETAKQLNLAFADFNLAEARRIRQQWSYWIARSALGTTDPLYREVQAALDWIKEEEQSEQQSQAFETELKKLESLLSRSNVDYEKIERQYQLVENFQREIPNLQQKRFQTLRENHRLARQRKSQLLIGSIIASLVIVFAVAGTYLYRSSYERHTASVLKIVEEFVAKEDFPQAERVLTTQIREYPHLGNNPDLQRLQSQIEKAIADEEQRRVLFVSFLERARQIVDQETTWGDLAMAETELGRAKTQSDQSPREGSEIQAIENDIQRKRRELQSLVNGEFHQRLGILQKRLEAVQQLATDEVEELRLELSRLQATDHLGAGLKQLVAAPLTQVAVEIERRKTENAKSIALAEVIASLGLPEAFAARLKAYITIDSKSSRGIDFQRILSEELFLLEKVSAWNQVVARWNGRKVSPLRNSFSEFDADIQLIQADFLGFPEVGSLVKFGQIIEPLRSTVKQDPYLKLQTFLQLPVVQKIRYIRNTVTKENHYFTSFPQLKGNRLEILELESLKGQTRTRTYPTSELLRFADGSLVGVTPHAEWANRSLKYLDENEAEYRDWTYEKRILSVIGDLLTSADIDPIFATHALDEIFVSTFAHSLPLKTILQDAHARFYRDVLNPVQNLDTELRIDLIDWLSPKEARRKELAKARHQEWKAELSIGDLAEKQLTVAFQELEGKKPRLADLQWVGCFLKANQAWEFHPSKTWNSETVGGGKLFVARIASGRVVGWQEVGVIENAQVRLTIPENQTGLSDGKLVFVMKQ
ncbi:MAG: hypothetical protein Q8M16_07480 [Pirellulaceae bacterium]|nr:hypothetical protein [Pirellulaceae bacterium]